MTAKLYKEDGDRLDKMKDSDLQLPAQRVGELMVFKVYDKVSIAILLRGKDVIGSHYPIEGLPF